MILLQYMTYAVPVIHIGQQLVHELLTAVEADYGPHILKLVLGQLRVVSEYTPHTGCELEVQSPRQQQSVQLSA